MSQSSVWIQQILHPRADDSSDVRWAVETATAAWARGERDLALRWLHHAVQAATAEGNHQRADDLDRAAQLLEIAPAPSAEPAVPSLGAAPSTERVESGSARGQKNPMMPTAPYRVALDDITHLEGPDTGLLKAAAQSVRESAPAETTAPVAKRPRPEPPRLSQDDEATAVNVGITVRAERTMVMDIRSFGANEPGAEAPPPAPIDVPPPEPTAPRNSTREFAAREPVAPVAAGPELAAPSAELAAPSVEPAVPSIPEVLRPRAVESPSASRSPETLGSPGGPLEPLRAVRVAVAAGVGRELDVRLLDDGELAPPGTQEALLLAVPARS